MTMYDHTFPLAESDPDNSTIIDEAQSLYDLGLNVLPVIHGSKQPYGEHGFVANTRLYRPWLPALFADSNLAVVTGRLSGNMVIVDCDSPETFAQIGGELSARQIRAWIRNGVDGGQYWLRCAEGELATTRIGAVEILSHGTYTLAPPSRHPDGINYRWLDRSGSLPPVVSLANLDFLPPLHLSSVRRQCPEKSHVLPPIADRVLIQQNATGYTSNSEAEYAACMSLASVGYADSEIMRLFETFAPPHYVKVGDRHFGQYVLASARAYVERADRVTARSGIAHSSSYVQWVQSQPWPGRTGATDRAVFLALCERMRMERGMPFRASIREVAELAGVNKETAMKALRRLTELGLVRHSNGPEEGHAGASHYRLVLPEENVNRTVGVTYTPVGVNVRSSDTGHDVWHSRAFGKSAQSCWAVLQEAGTLTVAELAARSGRTPPTIRRVLARLAEYGLAQADNKHWRVLDVASDALDRIALELGTSGKGEARTTKHQEERQRWASTRLLDQQQRWRERRPR